jgi:hypothetical protein
MNGPERPGPMAHAVAVSIDAAAAIRNAHSWFETNSGWAPPDPDTLAEWLADGMCRSPDGCVVAPAGWCAHGLGSWWLILAEADDKTGTGRQPGLGLAVPSPSRLDPNRPDFAVIMSAHKGATERGEPGYPDPTTGLFVMTATYLWERGSCCEQTCRHCPYLGAS